MLRIENKHKRQKHPQHQVTPFLEVFRVKESEKINILAIKDQVWPKRSLKGHLIIIFVYFFV
jgi:hypothetical protein